MSAIFYPTAKVRPTARLERLVLALGICLPVPAFAATGLSLPMPSAVERLAAALVPWAEAVQMSDRPITRGAAGTIVLTRSEQGASAAAPRVPTAPKPGSAAPKSMRAGKPARPVARRTTPTATATATATTIAPSQAAPAADAATPDIATTVAAQEPGSTPTAAPRTNSTAQPTLTLPAPAIVSPPGSGEPKPTEPTTPAALPLPLPAPVAEPVATVLQPVAPIVAPVLTPIVVAVEDTATKVLTPIGIKLPKLGG
jgi:hypothetical protein